MQPILLQRRPLHSRTEPAHSWLGGAPRLGAIQWPRCPHTQRPLHFVAQFDLAQLAPAQTPLPKTGQIGIFVSTALEGFDADPMYPGRVVFCETGTGPTAQPSDLGPTYEEDAAAHWLFMSDKIPAPTQFAEIPVEFAPLDMPPDASPDEIGARIETAKSPYYNAELAQTLPNAGGPWLGQSARFWASALHRKRAQRPDLVAHLEQDLAKAEAALAQHRAARPKPGLLNRIFSTTSPKEDRRAAALESDVARIKRDLDRHHANGPAYDAFVETCIEKAIAIPVDAPLSDTQVAHIRSCDDRLFEPDFRDVAPIGGYSDVGDGTLGLDTAFDALARGAFDLLPTDFLAYLDRYPCATGHAGLWHQIGGRGIDQYGTSAGDDTYMLAQFSSDDGLNWMWGDAGVVQVHIAHSDIAAGRWDRATFTLESH